MVYHIKNINTQSDFHDRVEALKKVSDADDQQLNTKLNGKQGRLEGRYVTLLKKLISLIPGIHLARTTPVEVAKAVGQFADDYSKKNFLTKNDQNTLTNVLDRLKTKGKAYLKGNEAVINSVIDKIKALPTVGDTNKSQKSDNKIRDYLNDAKAPPVLFAIFDRDINKIIKLIREGADINTPLGDGNLPLHIAAQIGDVEIIKLILKNTTKGINVLGNKQFTPLTFAAMEGKTTAVEELLRNGADANIAAVNGSVPLHFAAQAGAVESIKLLIPKTTGGIDALGDGNCTPLVYASMAGKTTAVQELLNEGADANIAALDWSLPLHFAAEVGNWEC